MASLIDIAASSGIAPANKPGLLGVSGRTSSAARQGRATWTPEFAKASGLGKAAMVTNLAYEGFKRLPGISQAATAVGGAVGLGGGLIGGAVGAAGQVGKNLLLGKPLSKGVWKSAKETAKETAKFGFETGKEAVPAFAMGAAGKVPNALMAFGAGYQGAKDVSQGIKEGDTSKALAGGLALGTAALGAYGAAKTKGLFVNPDAVRVIKGAPSAIKEGFSAKSLAKTLAKREEAIRKLAESSNPLRKAIQKDARFGTDALKVVTRTGLLDDSITKEGRIATYGDGKAIDKVRTAIDGQEGSVARIFETHGIKIPVSDVQKAMIASIDESVPAGAARETLYAKARAEVRGLAKGSSDGMVDAAKVQRLKTFKGSTMAKAYVDPAANAGDKAIVRGLKNAVEKAGGDVVSVSAINRELQKYYAVIDLLDALHGKVVEGGRLGKYFARTAGTIIGTKVGGIPGAFAGADVANRIQQSIMQGKFGGKVGTIPEFSPEIKRKVAVGLNQLRLPPARGTMASEISASGPAITPKPPFEAGKQSPAYPATEPLSKPLTKPFLQRQFEERMPTQRGLPPGTLSEGQSGQAIPLRGRTVIDMGKQTKPPATQVSSQASRALGARSAASLDEEISRRVEAFRKLAGMTADREGAGVSYRTVEDATGNVDFVAKDFSLNKAKGNMRRQADAYKKEAESLLYANDEEFARLVDQRDNAREAEIGRMTDAEEIAAASDRALEDILGLSKVIDTYAVQTESKAKSIWSKPAEVAPKEAAGPAGAGTKAPAGNKKIIPTDAELESFIKEMGFDETQARQFKDAIKSGS